MMPVHQVTRRAALAGLASAIAAPVQADQVFPFGQVFIAVSLAGVAFAEASQPTLTIMADGKASGTSGCNRFAGTATIKDHALSFGPLAMTRMACFGAAGDNERLFAPAISAATAWRMDGRVLVIETAKGPLRFRRR